MVQHGWNGGCSGKHLPDRWGCVWIYVLIQVHICNVTIHSFFNLLHKMPFKNRAFLRKSLKKTGLFGGRDWFMSEMTWSSKKKHISFSLFRKRASQIQSSVAEEPYESRAFSQKRPKYILSLRVRVRVHVHNIHIYVYVCTHTHTCVYTQTQSFLHLWIFNDGPYIGL